MAIVTGLLGLMGAGGWFFWTRHTGSQKASNTVEALRQEWSQAPPVARAVTGVSRKAAVSVPIHGRAFAIMTVPRFGAHWQMPVFEGTGTNVLRGGVGHYARTALPGEIGNFAVAGHRTTWARPFRDVDHLKTGDRVIVQTRQARLTYRVTGHEIVRPGDTDVLEPVPGQPGAVPDQARLTLTTCHPEYSAWERWVVHAVLVQTEPQ
nr:class E sortase [Kineosporia mesophila]